MTASKKLHDDQNFQEPKSGNPLAKYFRVPGVHIKLPTNGAFMPPGSVEFTMTGEVPVYPMRGADEMLLKSPDALMNGYAIEKLIQSCVPAIKYPRLISSPDLDVILIAIKAATYGEQIHLSPICPKCETVNQTHRHLGGFIDKMTMVEPENMVRLSDDVTVYLRPHNLENATRLGVASFEEARKVQALEGDEADQAARSQQMARSMARLATMNAEAMADCIIKVVVPDGSVTDKSMIQEFVANISKPWSDSIASALNVINSKGIDKTFEMKCAACGHEWQAGIEFNPATFFDPDSSAS